MRLHGSRLRTKDQPERNPGIIERSGGPNEIWCFGEENYKIIKSIIETRERLRPYIMKYMEEASDKGTPLMRPMFYEYYEDPVCYELEDQYLFGPDILFAPIMEKGQTERTVYLPEGRWVSVIDGKVYVGKQNLTVQAQLNQFIAFVKEGSEVLSVFF